MSLASGPHRNTNIVQLYAACAAKEANVINPQSEDANCSSSDSRYNLMLPMRKWQRRREGHTQALLVNIELEDAMRAELLRFRKKRLGDVVRNACFQSVQFHLGELNCFMIFSLDCPLMFYRFANCGPCFS